jgi:TonB family protein
VRRSHKTCDVVLEAVQRPRPGLLGMAAAGALVVHIGGAAAAFALSSHTERVAPRKSTPLVVVDHVIDLPPDPPKVEEPPPPPEVEPPKPKLKPPPKIKEAPKPEPVAEPVAEPTPPPPQDAPEPEKPPSEPPPAAQAGQVVAAEGPGDFKITTGSGPGYAGGTTTATGTGTQANHTGQIGNGTGNGYSKARPPQLRSRNWPCGWPEEAEELDLEHVAVTVRVKVNADGSLADVTVLKDPGYGFGKRAVWCARTKVRFDPALDPNGQPVAGETPAINVHFERDDY